MAKGTVKWFNEKKGFGFIVDPSVGSDIFVHFSAIQSEGFKTLQEGDQVEYELYTDEKGAKARNVVRDSLVVPGVYRRCVGVGRDPDAASSGRQPRPHRPDGRGEKLGGPRTRPFDGAPLDGHRSTRGAKQRPAHHRNFRPARRGALPATGIRSVAASLANEPRLIVATGGGIVTRPENISLLRTLGCVVFLNADEDVLWERVSRNQHRPLLQTADPRATLGELLDGRRALFTRGARTFPSTRPRALTSRSRSGVLAAAQLFFAGSGQPSLLP